MRSPMRSPRVSRAEEGWARPPGSSGVACEASSKRAGGLVFEVGGDDGGSVAVVAGVEDVEDGVPDPGGGAGGAEVVEDEDFGVEDGLEEGGFGGSDGGVVGVLDELEELLVVEKEAADLFFEDQGLEHGGGEVGFAEAGGADEDEAFSLDGVGVVVDEAAGGFAGEVEGGVFAVDLEGFEGFIEEARGDAGAVELALDAEAELAGALVGEAVAGFGGGDLEAGAFADGAGGHGACLSMAGGGVWDQVEIYAAIIQKNRNASTNPHAEMTSYHLPRRTLARRGQTMLAAMRNGNTGPRTLVGAASQAFGSAKKLANKQRLTMPVAPSQLRLMQAMLSGSQEGCKRDVQSTLVLPCSLP